MSELLKGYICSIGKTDGGVPYYNLVNHNHYMLEDEESYSLETVLVNPNYCRLPIIPYDKGFMMCGKIGNKLEVHYYKRGRGKDKRNYTVAKSWNIGIGAEYPTVSNMKMLQSGAILVVWYDMIFGSIRYPRFSYYGGKKRGKKWVTTKTEFNTLSAGMPAVTADFAQDSNGKIWYFAQGDSNKNITLIQLVDNGVGVDVVHLIPEFTSKYDELGNEGELPYIVTEPYGDDIILAYQSKYFHFFSTSPFCKGAKINVVRVHRDYTRELIYRTDDYAERTTPFALIGTSIIYGHIDIETLQHNKMYLRKEDGTKTFLTEVRYPILFRYTDTKYFCNGIDGKMKIIELM